MVRMPVAGTAPSCHDLASVVHLDTNRDSNFGGFCRRRSRSKKATPVRKRKHYTWAELMKRVFEIDVLRCPFCHSRRKLIAQITETPVIRAFLASLGLTSDPPELKPALWPP